MEPLSKGWLSRFRACGRPHGPINSSSFVMNSGHSSLRGVLELAAVENGGGLVGEGRRDHRYRFLVPPPQCDGFCHRACIGDFSGPGVAQSSRISFRGLGLCPFRIPTIFHRGSPRKCLVGGPHVAVRRWAEARFSLGRPLMSPPSSANRPVASEVHSSPGRATASPFPILPSVFCAWPRCRGRRGAATERLGIGGVVARARRGRPLAP